MDLDETWEACVPGLICTRPPVGFRTNSSVFVVNNKTIHFAIRLVCRDGLQKIVPISEGNILKKSFDSDEIHVLMGINLIVSLCEGLKNDAQGETAPRTGASGPVSIV
jgi:hypothetical protein